MGLDEDLGDRENVGQSRSIVKKTESAVDHPLHYNMHPLECIDAIRIVLTREEFRGFCMGNYIKYRWRCDHKGKCIEDLEKADWYWQKAHE